jgi:uncharacterized protein (TIGR02145 family)
MFSAQNAESETIISGNGYLYNWYAISDAKFAPTGWRVPSQSDWNTLQSALGGSTVAGGKIKSTLSYRWDSPNTGADNSSGLTLFGTGRRETSYIYFKIIGSYGSSTEYSIYYYAMSCASNSANMSTSVIGIKAIGCPVRLVKNNQTDPGTLTDYDSNIYTTVVIDTMVWIVENWKCTHLNDGTDIPEVTNQITWDGLTTGARCVYNNNEGYK